MAAQVVIVGGQDSPLPSMQRQVLNTKQEEKKETVVTASAAAALIIIGASIIALSLADLAAAIAAFQYGSMLAGSFSGCWAGCAFGILNGSLALRAGKEKRQAHFYWATVNFGFGLTCIILHFVDFGLALAAAVIYATPLSRTVRSKEKYTLYSETSPVVPEAVRVLVVALLLSLEICQILVCRKLRNYFISRVQAAQLGVLTYANDVIVLNGEVSVVPVQSGPSETTVLSQPPPSYDQVSAMLNVPLAPTPGPPNNN